MVNGDGGGELSVSAGTETGQAGESLYAGYPLIAVVLLGFYLISLHSYLLFHSVIEIVTISIGFTLFIITWNARGFLTNTPLRLLGIGYAFIALIDLLHTLAYKGMNVFPAHGANLPTQLWIGARYLQALILFSAPFFARRRLSDRLVLGASIASVVVTVGLIYSGNFPDCFIEGKGLTPFKITSEYVITAMLMVAILLFYRQWRSSRERIYLVIIASTACTIASELSFTAYVSVYGFANLLGHLFKLAAFYLIYRAILATGFKEPINLFFKELKQAYERLRETNANLETEIEERIHAEDELRQARDELEARVEARTAELRFANEQLQDELVEREHLQMQLFQAQKMEAIGQLAGGVAHDFNNILTAIIGFGSLLEMKMPSDDPQRASVNQILAAADRAAELTRSLLAFSRKQIMNPQPVDINQIVRQTSKFLQRIIGEDIELRTIFKVEPLPVNVDSPQMEQVLMNLATNARDVMPKGGILSITTELVHIGDDFIRNHGFGSHGEYALVSVSDTGSGMDESVRKRIFEPFFTTKEVGQGTGLGLSIVYGIIKQHNGYINVYSEPGQGTTFTIYLPSFGDEVVKKVDEVKSVSVEGTETILVADDDATLRMIAEEIFTTYGYTVITAEDGEDALHKFSLNRDRIALVVMDVIMPKMNGKETFDGIRALAPDCKVIFMSGYTDDIIHKRGLLDKGLIFVTKPLRPEKLLQKVREVLDGNNGSSGDKTLPG